MGVTSSLKSQAAAGEGRGGEWRGELERSGREKAGQRPEKVGNYAAHSDCERAAQSPSPLDAHGSDSGRGGGSFALLPAAEPWFWDGLLAFHGPGGGGG